MIHYLSKSDFKVAHDCPTKLYYKKKGYPNLNERDLYLQHLARGGYMVGKLATLYYQSGILIDTGNDHTEAIKETKIHCQKTNVTLFEAAIESKGKLVRVDILEKNDTKVNLIEVKSKSFESLPDEKKQKKILKELEEYIIDVAYQYFVIKEAYPEWEVKSYLYLPDKSKNTSIDGLNSLFEIKEVILPNSRFRKYDVHFDDQHLKEILLDQLMTLVDVNDRVIELQPQIKEETDRYLFSLKDGVEKILMPLSKDCFKCEYNLINDTFNLGGYDECWKDLPKVDHSISELYNIGSIGGYRNPLANQLIHQKRISLSEFPIESLKDGAQARRQKIQIKYTFENKEWIDEELKKTIKGLEYPLHFIDFETTSPALPFKKGMRPYEPIVFQWSCHTIREPSAEPNHNEWISLTQEFPNFLFAESLMEVIGYRGTPLMWSPYENTMLKTIHNQMGKYDYINKDLKEWIERTVKFNDDDEGRLIDMNKIALDGYFHPLMKGKTSIKWTLPAVLSSDTSLANEKLLQNFEPQLSLLKRDNEGKILDPYKLLPAIEIYNKAELIQDGTGAMRAYEDIMFGLNKGNLDELAKYKTALLRYCKLDTLAMVIIWKHWETLS